MIAITGTIFLLRATPEGLGLSDDSIAYIAGARSLLAGHGYREAWLASNGPVTHFPPGLSSVLAFVGLYHYVRKYQEPYLKNNLISTPIRPNSC